MERNFESSNANQRSSDQMQPEVEEQPKCIIKINYFEPPQDFSCGNCCDHSNRMRGGHRGRIRRFPEFSSHEHYRNHPNPHPSHYREEYPQTLRNPAGGGLCGPRTATGAIPKAQGRGNYHNNRKYFSSQNLQTNDLHHILPPQLLPHQIIKNFNLQHLDTRNYNVQHPNVQHPNVQHPNVQHPNVQHPNVQHPNVQHPNVQHPNFQQPNFDYDGNNLHNLYYNTDEKDSFHSSSDIPTREHSLGSGTTIALQTSFEKTDAEKVIKRDCMAMSYNLEEFKTTVIREFVKGLEEKSKNLESAVDKKPLSENVEKPSTAICVKKKKVNRYDLNNCRYCQTAKKEYEHPMFNEDRDVVCPVLGKYRCPFCGATGTNAHTVKYCPKNPILKGHPTMIRTLPKGKVPSAHLEEIFRINRAADRCYFCKERGMVSDHKFKNNFGEVVCPILSAMTCPRCLQTGVKAHTVGYCKLPDPNLYSTKETEKTEETAKSAASGENENVEKTSKETTEAVPENATSDQEQHLETSKEATLKNAASDEEQPLQIHKEITEAAPKNVASDKEQHLETSKETTEANPINAANNKERYIEKMEKCLHFERENSNDQEYLKITKKYTEVTEENIADAKKYSLARYLDSHYPCIYEDGSGLYSSEGLTRSPPYGNVFLGQTEAMRVHDAMHSDGSNEDPGKSMRPAVEYSGVEVSVVDSAMHSDGSNEDHGKSMPPVLEYYGVDVSDVDSAMHSDGSNEDHGKSMRPAVEYSGVEVSVVDSAMHSDGSNEDHGKSMPPGLEYYGVDVSVVDSAMHSDGSNEGCRTFLRPAVEYSGETVSVAHPAMSSDGSEKEYERPIQQSLGCLLDKEFIVAPAEIFSVKVNDGDISRSCGIGASSGDIAQLSTDDNGERGKVMIQLLKKNG